MNKYRIILTVCCAFSMSAQAAEFYDQSWEFPTLPNQPRDTASGYWYHGNCFSKAGGDLFNSVELSSKYARIGSKSVRMYRDSLIPNSKGHGICESFLKAETDRHRNEIRYGYGKGVGTLQSWDMGAERWFRQSIYIPSDEGNFSTWNASGKRVMLSQWIGSEGSDHSHELAFLLEGGPKAIVEGYYGTSATSGTEYQQIIGSFNLKKDAWNDIVVRHRRSWQTAAENPTGHGIVQVWANCSDWANCTPVVNYSGRAAIRWLTTGWFKTGLYGMLSTTWQHQHAVYMDAIKMGVRGSETESQMLGLMAADYGVATTPPEPPVNFSVE